ncbi:CHAP domain-containing protein [Ktedonospora formicarum]|uniref:Peptidase C51 domain-containing protein n=1 Tax=Ktedonospora formicarum TaxID=2778364 RepID=A0A8J3MW52_9CHLR|nr:CHAP domain-containing protein [Ktedonospora formicarum]GHO48596.1 hypothetical protein KSX_67590 [Ktedonospora formicarum]
MLKLILIGGALLSGMGLLLTTTVTMDAQGLQQQDGGVGGGPGTAFIDTHGSGKRAEVVHWALAMAAHLHCTPARLLNDCQGSGADHYYDQGFPPQIVAWSNTHCPGCASWRSDNYQCVVFVIAAYASVRPLPVQGQNANQYWEHFAAMPGWQRLPTQGHLPQAGDIMVWSGGPFGHVSIVLGSDPAHRSVTFAQANGEYPIQTLPLYPDGSVNTANGYWNAFSVMGYLHALTLS